jgi:predicted metal-dependent enzyme (double-stranded beta helix superfamily)
MKFSVEDFVAVCSETNHAGDAPVAIADVLRAHLVDPAAVADVLAPERAGITLLHHGADLTIINVVWPPGMRIFAHDHRMWAAIGVYTGCEDNQFFRRDGDTLVPSNGRRLEATDVIVLGPDTIHAVHNPDRRPTGAIHVYGGDFVNQPRSQWRAPALVEESYDAQAVNRAFEHANETWLH